MKKITERALRSSIRHWERCAQGVEAAGSGASCALCERFVHNGGPVHCTRCDGEKCPVFKSTGENGCGGTPFSLWQHLTPSNNTLERFVDTDDMFDTITAKAEALFLRSLLPKD